MELKATFSTETDHTPEGETRIGRTYWNSWDGELFTVTRYPTTSQATVVSITDGTRRTREKEAFAVDFERIHPAELVDVASVDGEGGR